MSTDYSSDERFATCSHGEGQGFIGPYQFGQVTMAPGAFLVLTKDRAAFESQYGQTIFVLDEYSSNLSHGGERLVLEDLTQDMGSEAVGGQGPWEEKKVRK